MLTLCHLWFSSTLSSLWLKPHNLCRLPSPPSSELTRSPPLNSVIYVEWKEEQSDEPPGSYYVTVNLMDVPKLNMLIWLWKPLIFMRSTGSSLERTEGIWYLTPTKLPIATFLSQYNSLRSWKKSCCGIHLCCRNVVGLLKCLKAIQLGSCVGSKSSLASASHFKSILFDLLNEYYAEIVS